MIGLRSSSPASWLKTFSTATLIVAISTLAIWLLFPLIGLLFPALRTVFYSIAVYGAYPEQNFISSSVIGPRPSHVRWDARCDTGVILLTPNGPSVSRPGPMILDSRGQLVWQSTEEAFAAAANLKVQQYRGEEYLTFWAGKKAGSQGKGKFYMLDSSYEISHVVDAVGEGLHGDLHEFKITPEGTALITVYHTIEAPELDTRHGLFGLERNWFVDSILQEIDISTGTLLFEWRASDHFLPEDSYYFSPFAGYSSHHPYDYFHLNSIDKDDEGNYLISSRHTHTITCIDPSGEVSWILGGKKNQFLDLSVDRKATSFKWQHDARWHPASSSSPKRSLGEILITLFDNGKAGPLNIDAPQSQGLLLHLDIRNRTATALQSYISPTNILSSSQGFVQILPSFSPAKDEEEKKGHESHVFIGWGSSTAYTEFLPNGTVLCETHLAASMLFSWERVKSYRAIKVMGWQGRPKSDPAIRIRNGGVYVSWNGATDVRSWILERACGEDGSGGFCEVDVVMKGAFETRIEVPDEVCRGELLRIVAMADDGEKLYHSPPVKFDGGFCRGRSLSMIGFIGFALGCVVWFWRNRRLWPFFE